MATANLLIFTIIPGDDPRQTKGTRISLILSDRDVDKKWGAWIRQNEEKMLSGRRGSDRMVVIFTTTYAIRAYHHWCCEFESRSGQGVQHYVIKFVSDLRQVGGFLRVLHQ
jgi:hypothetical protein